MNARKPIRATQNRFPLRAVTGKLQPYLLFLPAAVFVLSVTAYPIIDLFYISFHATNYFRVGEANGAANFLSLLNRSGAKSTIASTVFVVGSDVLTIVVALVLALVMEAPLRARGFLRTTLILPWLVSEVVTALLWQALLDANFGPVALFIRAITGHSVGLLSSGAGAMATMIVANAWRSYPYALVLLLAALQSIPSELYEAARMDGASRWDEFRHIVLPMAGRTATVVVILLTFQNFTLVTIPFILTGGGPNDATYVLSLRIWRQAFTNYQFGFSAATGVVVFLLNLGLSLFYIRYFTKRDASRVS